MRVDAGSLLVFLPGAGEIRRTETLLRERVADPTTDIVALYARSEAEVRTGRSRPRRSAAAGGAGNLDRGPRLTIEGVRVVIDCGLARVPRSGPDVG